MVIGLGGQRMCKSEAILMVRKRLGGFDCFALSEGARRSFERLI